MYTKSTVWYHSLWLPHQNTTCISILPQRATGYAQTIHLDFFTFTLDEKHKLWSSSCIQFSQHPVTSTDPNSNIPLDALSRWVTFRCLSSSSSLWVRVELGKLCTCECHMLANDLCHRTLTNGRWRAWINWSSCRAALREFGQITENHAVLQKSRRQTRREHIPLAEIASLNETKITSLRT